MRVDLEIKYFAISLIYMDVQKQFCFPISLKNKSQKTS